VRRAVAPGPLQLHPHAAVAEQPQPIFGQGRAEEVAAQLLYSQLDASYLHETRPVTEPGALSAFPLL
jgi:hypothetical protein